MWAQGEAKLKLFNCLIKDSHNCRDLFRGYQRVTAHFRLQITLGTAAFSVFEGLLYMETLRRIRGRRLGPWVLAISPGIMKLLAWKRRQPRLRAAARLCTGVELIQRKFSRSANRFKRQRPRLAGDRAGAGNRRRRSPLIQLSYF